MLELGTDLLKYQCKQTNGFERWVFPPAPPKDSLLLGRRSRVRPRAWHPLESPEVALGIAVQPGFVWAFRCRHALPRPRQPLPLRLGGLLRASAATGHYRG